MDLIIEGYGANSIKPWEGMMSYVVTWLDHDKVIAELEFDNLFSAESHVSKSTRTYQRRGATSARVWDDRATYFQIEWPDPMRNGLLH